MSKLRHSTVQILSRAALSWLLPLSILVTGLAITYARADSWSSKIELRDDSSIFPNNKPAGGRRVAPIHATLSKDGKVAGYRLRPS